MPKVQAYRDSLRGNRRPSPESFPSQKPVARTPHLGSLCIQSIRRDIVIFGKIVESRRQPLPPTLLLCPRGRSVQGLADTFCGIFDHVRHIIDPLLSNT